MAAMGWATQAAAASCPCTDVFVGTAQPFIAEGIARDAATDRFFIASVATRRIVMIHAGHQSDFAQLPDDYSPLGIALSGGTLWVTAATVPQGSGHDGPSALIAMDKDNGHVQHVYPVADAGPHVFNDLIIVDGEVYVSDARGGEIYVLMQGMKGLSRLGLHALFKSPQGMVLNTDGSLLVADYSLGLMKLDLATATATPMEVSGEIDLKGIDGLVRLPDGRLLASQNGTRAPHILRLAVTPSLVVSAEVVAQNDPAVADPSLVMADQSGAYVVGVSQWASFAKDQQAPTAPLQPWRIVKLALKADP
jgi:hypothetical protein